MIPEEETSEEEVSWLGKLIAKLETKVDSDKINSFISKLIVTGEDADDEDNSEDADDADETAFIAPWYPMYPLIHFVTIDSGVTSIGANAFPNCALGSITIPTSVIRIGDKAFEDCLIEDVYYAGTEEEWKKIQMGVGNSEAFENATMHYLGSKQDEDSDSKSDGKSSDGKDTGAKDAQQEDEPNVIDSPATGESAPTLALFAMLASLFSMAAAFLIGKLRMRGSEEC